MDVRLIFIVLLQALTVPIPFVSVLFGSEFLRVAWCWDEVMFAKRSIASKSIELNSHWHRYQGSDEQIQMKDYIAQSKLVWTCAVGQNLPQRGAWKMMEHAYQTDSWIQVASANRLFFYFYSTLSRAAFTMPLSDLSQFSFLCGHLRLLQQGYVLQYGAEGKVIGFGSHFSFPFLLMPWFAPMSQAL